MHYFYSWIELCKNNEVKLRMIEAGHSASEIERVICAGKAADEDEEDGAQEDPSPRRPGSPGQANSPACCLVRV